MSQVDPTVLKKHHLFRHLDEGQMEEMVRAARVLEVDDGATLFLRGEPAESFFMVTRGRIKLFRTSKSGDEKIIQVMGRGQVFAEGVLFPENAAYPVNASSLGPSVVYRFSNRVFRGLLEDSHALCIALFADISGRLHGMLNEVDRLALQNARYRLAWYLEEKRRAGDGDVVTLDVSRKTIASLLSITPETLSRILRDLADHGVIQVSGRRIHILDPERLGRPE